MKINQREIFKQLNITHNEKEFLNNYWNDEELILIENNYKGSTKDFLNSTIEYYNKNHNTTDLKEIAKLKENYI